MSEKMKSKMCRLHIKANLGSAVNVNKFYI